MSEPKRLKVLLSAYACEPGKGSEPGVGWNWALQMARFHDVWVLTRANNRQNIEAANPPSSIRWIYYDLPSWSRFWKRGNRGVQLYYGLWLWRSSRKAARLHREIGFDLFHHVTFGKYWVPVFHSLLGIPSILGPMGGGESAPRSFYPTFSREGRWFEWKRDLVRSVARLDPITRACVQRSRLTLATTGQTAVELRGLGSPRVEVHPQCGMTSEELEFFSEMPIRTEGPVRFISIGRLLHWKAYHLSLEAFARFRREHPKSEYWLINDGPEAERLKSLARSLGVESSVKFLGRVPSLTDVYQRLSECDVLVHPALHEAFGNVCLEALAAGRPVICLDLGGPALQVTEGTGLKVPAPDPETAIRGLVEAMCRLANPQVRVPMARAARERARNGFHWDEKGAQMNRYYFESLAAL